MGPNIVSLILNRDHDSKEYPYSAALLGDHEFPYDKIIKNEQLESLRDEMREWKDWQQGHLPATSRNRFLFQEGKKFFETPYSLRANVEGSLVHEMEDWTGIHDTLSEVILPPSRSDVVS